MQMLRFESFDELEKIIGEHKGQSYSIIWDNDDAESYTGWIELY